MSSPVVGRAAIEITSDLSAFATSTESKIRSSMTTVNHEVEQGFSKSGDGAARSGHAVGAKFSTSVASEAAAGGRRAGDELATGLRGRVNEGVGRLRSGLKSQFGEMAKLAVGLFAADKVKEIISSGFDLARESQKINAQTATVIRNTGAAAGVSSDQVKGLAGEISDYAGIDHQAIQAGENLLLNFRNIKNQTGENNDIFTRATGIATDLSVATGMGLTGAMKLVGKALNDPIKGMNGLARVGVALTAQQKEQIKTLVAHGRALDAQKIILGQLDSRFKGSAASQATQGEKMKVAFNDLKESVGSALIPVVDRLEVVLTKDIIPAFRSTLGFLERHGSTVKVVATALGILAAAWVVARVGLAAYRTVQAISAVLSGEQAAATGLQTLALGAQKIALGIATAAQWAFNAAMDANPIMLVILAIGALVAVFILAWKNSATFREIVTSAFDAVKAAGVAVWHFLQAAWTSVGKPLFDIMLAVVKIYWTVYKAIFLAVVAAFVAVWHFFVAAWNSVGKPLFDLLVRAVQMWWSIQKAIFGLIVSAFRAIYTAARDVWNSVGRPIFDAISTVVQAWWDLQKRIFGLVIAGFRAVVGFFVSAGRTIAGVWNAIATAISGAWTAIRNAWSNIRSWLGGIKDKIVGMFSDAVHWLEDAGHRVFSGLLHGIESGFDDIVGWFKDLPGKILSALGIHSPPEWAISAGKWIVHGLKKGLTSAAAIEVWFGSLAGRLAKSLLKGVMSPGAPGGDNPLGLLGNWLGIPGFAAGGSVPDGLFVSGEAGPEIGLKRGNRLDLLSNRDSRAVRLAGAESIRQRVANGPDRADSRHPFVVRGPIPVTLTRGSDGALRGYIQSIVVEEDHFGAVKTRMGSHG